MEKNILIYAVDDEEAIRELYIGILENVGFKIKCFENGTAMLEELKKEIPDLFILDIMLDGLNGYELVQELRKNNQTKDLPIILVSAKGEEMSKVKGLNLGADDYIEKPFGVIEFVARINAKLRNVKKQLYSYQDITIDDSKHEVFINKKTVNLTIKEYNLLLLLLKNNNKVVPRNQILSQVWGTDFYGETRTLDMHIATLRKYLNNSTVEIQTVRGIGYKMV